ncbi:hypothetical protein C7R54_15505 [Achromobacter aloeverae]|uniref:Uncharacterized protein n=1 Tax=Achromobacter aloeverae TaxID=1750518 RepID=A0A4Q1HIC3_9BURK|nr:hypothetical protein C7R54_15505 [Achromobacter aloeverae]
MPANIAAYFRWLHDEAPTLSLATHKQILLEMETYFRADERRKTLEEAAAVASCVGRPVGAGDGDTYVPGTSADAARAIRALIDRKEPTT